MFQRIDTVIIRVRDLREAVSWYQRVLHLEVAYEDATERLAVMTTPEGSSVTLWELKPGEELASGDGVGTYPIFAVEDADAAHAALQAQGVDLDPLSDGEGVRFFGFRDLYGNRLEACQVFA